MSVVFFSVEELGNLAAAYVRAQHVTMTHRDDFLKDAAHALAGASFSNAAAWTDRYGEPQGREGVALTADEIFAMAKQLSQRGLCSTDKAVGTMVSLQYNCDDETLCGCHAELLRMACALLRATNKETL